MIHCLVQENRESSLKLGDNKCELVNKLPPTRIDRKVAKQNAEKFRYLNFKSHSPNKCFTEHRLNNLTNLTFRK